MSDVVLIVKDSPDSYNLTVDTTPQNYNIVLDTTTETIDCTYTDAIIPSNHAVTHKLSGSDPLTLGDIVNLPGDPNLYLNGTGGFTSTVTFTESDRIKFDSIESGATKNSSDSFLLNLSNHTGTFDSILLNTNPAGSANYGKIIWNVQEQAPEIGLSSTTKSILGRDSHSYIYNSTASTFTIGQVVREDGSSGNRLQVALALANNDLNSATTIGVVCESISSNSSGNIITKGLLRGVNTNSFNEGDILWLSPITPGLITNTMPEAPFHGIRIGYCVKKAGSGAGIIYIDILNGFELNELHDVKLTTSGNTAFLIKNLSNEVWEDKSISETRSILQLGSAALSNSGDFAPNTHSSRHVTGGTDKIRDATASQDGLMTSVYASKLDGIQSGAEVNINADWNATSGDALILNKPSLGSSAALNTGNSINTVAVGNDPRFTDARTPLSHSSSHTSGGSDTIRLATALQDGLMSPDYANKLDGIAVNANNYILPVATPTVIGGVKRNSGSVGEFIQSIDSSGNLVYATPSGGSSGISSVNLSSIYTSTGISIGNDSGSGIILNSATNTLAGLMTNTDRLKLTSIQSGAEKNINADWNSTSGSSVILNKPDLTNLNTISNIAIVGLFS